MTSSEVLRKHLRISSSSSYQKPRLFLSFVQFDRTCPQYLVAKYFGGKIKKNMNEKFQKLVDLLIVTTLA